MTLEEIKALVRKISDDFEKLPLSDKIDIIRDTFKNEPHLQKQFMGEITNKGEDK